ncbi:NAD(P)H-dependent oxidoreductase [Sorangium sp. So ce295]|uniref:NAD(P)H-dependent oxidoreductase n=1 Tax=Sorangium sp. So ce295 TaxID=3133295 RepID=UPI003F6061FE
MKRLLRIDASARTQGSISRSVADYFQVRWTESNPGGRVIVRDLARYPVPHLDAATIAAFLATPPPSGGPPPEGLVLSDALIDELSSADHLLISSPLYNLTLPSTLKAYFDHVIRNDRTFAQVEGRYVGLLTSKSASVVTARGGVASPAAEDELQTRTLRAILAFIGVTKVDVISLEGMSGDEATRSRRVACARAEIDRLFASPGEPVCLGPFTEEDRRQIGGLRAAQAAAIQRGDAEAYAALCTDDIQLLIPGHEVVSGRERFLACEAELFRSASFASFRKTPERIERSGDLAVEVGRQEVAMRRGGAAGVFAARQKYTHVFRRTAQGWRFAVLMSNAIE